MIFACTSPVCQENILVCYENNLKGLTEGPVTADSECAQCRGGCHALCGRGTQPTSDE